MADTADILSECPDISAGELKASARGGLICALFGSAWMYWAVVFSGHPTPIWFSAVSLPAITLTIWAILRILAFRDLISSASDLQHWKSFRKFLGIDSVIEWVLVGIGTFLLSRIGRYDLIPQLFGLIIGLHFLPIAKVFQLPRYYWVGAIMIAGELFFSSHTSRRYAQHRRMFVYWTHALDEWLDYPLAHFHIRESKGTNSVLVDSS
jgi:hypothetical protein